MLLATLSKELWQFTQDTRTTEAQDRGQSGSRLWICGSLQIVLVLRLSISGTFLTLGEKDFQVKLPNREGNGL